ncbi:hypothetical protein [Microbispora bryophytorum]|uniref:Uncharacterized protein n=1 Tax=Microbispora bryophytorum TaxID=1460882 RepID=A0A8H9H124_9ACTN|nr:hypothetical protein [Microbispora bryophytorum]MBD3138722.1 hypothetical protein [Microbispora bryophytorum]TQS03740.1 hypothetical protein FLX07_24140 [Microbispora bryophytorum]GGO02302.1 hypothetical protein GCM10011574_11000 [Microbispora bryophytorum]
MTVQAKALITLLPSDQGGLPHELPSRTQSLVICACTGEEDSRLSRPFQAAITADDEEPLTPGDRLHVVTIATTDDDAVEYLRPGERFRLWCGHDVGSGIVSRRLI